MGIKPEPPVANYDIASKSAHYGVIGMPPASITFEIIPRPVRDSGLLQIETSRMQPLGQQDAFLQLAMQGASTERICDELHINQTTVRRNEQQVRSRLDARTLTEGGRIAIETGTVMIPRQSDTSMGDVSNGMKVLYGQMSRGNTKFDLAELWGISLSAVEQLRGELFEVAGVPSDACVPEAALVYNWYVSGREKQRADAAKRYTRIKSYWNTRELLDKSYPGYNFKVFNDTDTHQVMDKLPSILDLTGMHQDSKSYRYLLAYVKGGQSLQEIAQTERGEPRAVYRAKKYWRQRIGALGGPHKLLALAGVEVRLPCKREPPLSRGLSMMMSRRS
jgi:hypothetical protein